MKKKHRNIHTWAGSCHRLPHKWSEGICVLSRKRTFQFLNAHTAVQVTELCRVVYSNVAWLSPDCDHNNLSIFRNLYSTVGRLISCRSVAAGRANNDAWQLKSISHLLYGVVATLAITVCLTLDICSEKKSNTSYLKIDWKAVFFLSIATVQCRALGGDGVDSLSTLFTLCICSCVCECVCALYVLLWAGLCLFVDKEFQDVVCLVESISVVTSNEWWNSETLAPAKTDNEVFTICCQLSNPQRTIPHRYKESLHVCAAIDACAFTIIHL